MQSAWQEIYSLFQSECPLRKLLHYRHLVGDICMTVRKPCQLNSLLRLRLIFKIILMAHFRESHRMLDQQICFICVQLI